MKYIVTTTIQSPTEATLKFANLTDWTLIVVGDKKTPHTEYKKLNCIYLTPDYQEKTYTDLSNALGWNTIQRRNVGFIEAFRRGCSIVATVDDDNIPYPDWGKNIVVDKEVSVASYLPQADIFDPLSVTNHNDLWHRGFPIEYLSTKNNVEFIGYKTVTPKIQANLWDGDPDVDAMCRLTKKPIVKFDTNEFYTTPNITVFNSQNTFISRDVLGEYMVFPFVGRMDDIWGGYHLQLATKCPVVFGPATVYQERNPQDLVKNLENETIGYRNTSDFIKGIYPLPDRTREAFKIYRSYF